MQGDAQDARRPLYILDRRNAKSRFYKSIHVSYPNEQDKQSASQRGVSAGGDIMIHGLPNGFGWLGATHRSMDWIDGCDGDHGPGDG